MGGRGSYDQSSNSIPFANREYSLIGTYGNIQIIEGIKSKNGKTPVMSNGKNSVYAVWSETVGCIKHVFYYKNHVLYKAVDLEGAKSHWHKVNVNPETGEIGRISHDKENVFKPTPEMWDMINHLMKWKKTK